MLPNHRRGSAQHVHAGEAVNNGGLEGPNNSTAPRPAHPVIVGVKQSMLDAALHLAERGWFVFEARYKWLEKTRKWNKQGRWSAKQTNGLNWGMSKDPAEIRKLWVRYPDDPLGIPTGSVNDMFVVDIDTVTLDGHKFDGFASLRALEEKYGPLPPTLMAQSPT
jgi:hypothetical protein